MHIAILNYNMAYRTRNDFHTRVLWAANWQIKPWPVRYEVPCQPQRSTNLNQRLVVLEANVRRPSFIHRGATDGQAADPATGCMNRSA
jgi:hypothetical protein